MMLLVLAAVASAQTRPVPATAYTNIQSNYTVCAGNISEVLTEFDVRPVVEGRGIRFATTNWGIGDETTNPYGADSVWFGNDKYPGYQETRVPANSIFVEYAIRRADGSWLKLRFGGAQSGEVPPGEHRWTDWLDTQVSPTKPLRVRMRVTVRTPFLDRILRGNANAYDPATSKTYAGMNAPSIDVPAFAANANRAVKAGNDAMAHIYPAIVQTRTASDVEGVFVLGDSILRANSDLPSAHNPEAQVAPGWIGRGLRRLQVPVVAAGTSGDASFLSDPALRSRMWALVEESGCRTGIVQLGTNDAASGSSAGGSKPAGLELLQRARAQATRMRQAGIDRVYAAGLMPLTTSPAAWTEVGSQKLRDFDHNPPNWQQYNDLLDQTQTAPLDGTILPLPYVGTADGKWRTLPAESTGVVARAGDGWIEFVPPTANLVGGRYVGYVVQFLDGPAAGGRRYVAGAAIVGSALRLTFSVAGIVVGAGDRFELVPVLTRDGVHPSPLANQMASQAIVDRAALFVGDRRF